MPPAAPSPSRTSTVVAMTVQAHQGAPNKCFAVIAASPFKSRRARPIVGFERGSSDTDVAPLNVGVLAGLAAVLPQHDVLGAQAVADVGDELRPVLERDVPEPHIDRLAFVVRVPRAALDRRAVVHAVAPAGNPALGADLRVALLDD